MLCLCTPPPPPSPPSPVCQPLKNPVSSQYLVIYLPCAIVIIFNRVQTLNWLTDLPHRWTINSPHSRLNLWYSNFVIHKATTERDAHFYHGFNRNRFKYYSTIVRLARGVGSRDGVTVTSTPSAAARDTHVFFVFLIDNLWLGKKSPLSRRNAE